MARFPSRAQYRSSPDLGAAAERSADAGARPFAGQNVDPWFDGADPWAAHARRPAAQKVLAVEADVAAGVKSIGSAGKDSGLLAKVCGRWRDTSGSEYDVVAEIGGRDRKSESCTVTTRRKDGQVLVGQSLIHLTKDGQVAWGPKSQFTLDASSATKESVTWACKDPRGKAFTWHKIDDRSSSASRQSSARPTSRGPPAMAYSARDAEWHGFREARRGYQSDISGGEIRRPRSVRAFGPASAQTPSARAGSAPSGGGFDLILGHWKDQLGSLYEVIPHGSPWDKAASCSVTTTRSDGRTQRGAIHLDEEGRISWGFSGDYIVDKASASHSWIRWINDYSGKGFDWTRIEASEAAFAAGKFVKAKEVCNDFRRGECRRGDSCRYSHDMSQASSGPGRPRSSSKPRRTARAAPHFCIFQGDAVGLKGWTLQNGSRDNRWDMLLDTLRESVMMDGEWPREVCSSLFVGGDAIHVSGAVQRLAMPVVGQKSDGRPMISPATQHAWERILWAQKGKNQAGLGWELAEAMPRDETSAREALLARVDTLLEAATGDSIVMAFECKSSDAVWDDLVCRGAERSPKAEHVFCLLGGSRGFDGSDDADESFVEAIIARFAERFGRERVLRVSLGDGLGGGMAPAKVAGFLATEYVRGTLSRAVAAVEMGVDCNRHGSEAKKYGWLEHELLQWKADHPESEDEEQDLGSSRWQRRKARSEGGPVRVDGAAAECGATSERADSEMELGEDTPKRVQIRVTDWLGRKASFQIKYTSPLHKLIGSFCKHFGVQAWGLQLAINGKGLEPGDTAESLGLQARDSVDIIFADTPA